MSTDVHQAEPTASALRFPTALADRCVKCGLCLPHCPTYTLKQDEGESPRGRIALMQALDSGQLEASAALQSHLDNCLDCRRCEVVCPADVPYGQVLDAGRALLQSQTSRSALPSWVAALTQPGYRRWLHRLLWLGQRLGLRWLARRAPLPQSLRRLVRYWPQLARPRQLPSATPEISNSRGKLALFTGCVGSMAGQAALHHSMALLQALGYRVESPTAQACCGALHLHTGSPAKAAQLAQENAACFANAGYQALLGCDSGCVATLAEYPASFPEHYALPPVMDVCGFVQQHWQAGIRLKPLPARALLHLPCTQRNVLRNEQAVVALLQRIPGLEVTPLTQQGCCGAAGSYWLKHPQTADALVAPIVDEVTQRQPAYLLTSNVGCAMHLAAHLPDHVRIMHPLGLLYQQWLGH